MTNEVLRIGLLVIYATISVAGMVMLKSAESVISIKSGVGFALYLVGFLIWTGLILRVIPLSQAFPMAAGALMLGTQLAGWMLLKERIGMLQLSGAALILAGIILVSLTAQVRN